MIENEPVEKTLCNVKFPRSKVFLFILVNILHLLLRDFMRHEFIVSGISTIHNAFRANFDDMIGDGLDELVIM